MKGKVPGKRGMLHRTTQLQITIYPLGFVDILEKVLTTYS